MTPLHYLANQCHKAILFFSFCSLCLVAHSQWSTSDASNNIHNTNVGNVGIGTSTPQFKLDVAGVARVAGTMYYSGDQYQTSTTQGNWDYYNGGGGGWYFRWIQNGATAMTLSTGNNLLLGSTTDGGYRLDVTGTARFSSGVRLAGLTSDNTQTKVIVGDANGNLFLRDASTLGSGGGTAGWSLTGNTAVNPATTFLGTTDNSPFALRTNNAERLRIDGAGNVGIGTSSPQSLLAVKGTITAQKMVVTQTGWADYVFGPGYRLLPLSSLEKYVQANQHLPEVPTADSIAATGVNVGDTEVLLLKKVEELTLYIIDQNKQIAAQNQRIDALTTRLKKLEGK